MTKTELMMHSKDFLEEYIQLCEKYQLMLSPDMIRSYLSIYPMDKEKFELFNKNLEKSIKWWNTEDE